MSSAAWRTHFGFNVFMMNQRFAVADLGTNIFHLLIAEGTLTDHYKIEAIQEAVKLGEGGINKGYILPRAFERGIKAMNKFRGLLEVHQVQQVRAIATSALRNASNGADFIDEVKAQTGIIIEIVNGDMEAGFIYKGIKAAGCLSKKTGLIVDIGGGSVEFIICDENGIKWKQSFEIGVARLMDKFHNTDPIPPESITALNLYLEDSLKDMFLAVSHHPIQNIIGSSGVFETYAGLIESNKGNPFDLRNKRYYQFYYNELLQITSKLILSSHQERLAMQGIIPIRVDMIVTASVLTRFVMEKLEIDFIAMSTNSLKEGVLAEMMS